MFLPGHDAKLFSAMVKALGGVTELRQIVERHLGRPIVTNAEPRAAAAKR
jgi:hypothetical protein